MIRIPYRVHSVAVGEVATKASRAGREVSVMMPGITVELVGVDNDHGPSFTILQEDMKEEFKVGDAVNIDLSRGE